MKNKVIIMTMVMIMLVSSFTFGLTINGITIPDTALSSYSVHQLATNHPEVFMQYDHIIASQNYVYGYNDDVTATWNHSSVGQNSSVVLPANKHWRINGESGLSTLMTTNQTYYIYYTSDSGAEIQFTGEDIVSSGVVRLAQNLFYKNEFEYDSTTGDTLTWTNTTDNIRQVKLYSEGVSNVTVSSPTKYANTSNIGTSKLTFSLLPDETFTVTRNSGDIIHLDVLKYEAPEIVAPQNEFMYITNPPDDYQTVSKYIVYWVSYQINGTSVNDILLKVRNINNVPLASDTTVLKYELRDQKASVVNGVVKGSFTLEVQYQNTFVGTTGITVIAENGTKSVADTKNVIIGSFIDADADGIDDNTGDEPYKPPTVVDESGIPQRDDFTDDIWGEVSYGFERIMYYITMPLRWIADSLKSVTTWLTESSSWLTEINTFLSGVMGFMPDEIMSAIMMLVTVFVIFAIIKVIRG